MNEDAPWHVLEPSPFTEDEQGIFRALVADHRTIDGLLERLELGEGDRDDLIAEVTRALLAHMKAEERAVYAVLEEQQVLDGGAGDDRFLEQVLRLRAAVRHHVHEEEEDILQRAALGVGLEESREMARVYQAEKQDELADLGAHAPTQRHLGPSART